MKKIGIMLVDDNRNLRDGFSMIIEQQTDFNLLAVLKNIGNAQKYARETEPDVLLLGLGMTNQKSFDLIKSVIRESPRVQVIVMGLIPLREEILQFIEAGVSGFILKDATIDDFLETIRLVAKGEKVLPSDMTRSLFSLIVDHGLQKYGESKLVQSIRMTKQEREIVLLIADGLTNKEIAQKSHQSTYTVKSHVHNILEKMVLSARIQYDIYYDSNKDSDQCSGGDTQKEK